VAFGGGGENVHGFLFMCNAYPHIIAGTGFSCRR
jgi:hypothetical protein